MATKKTTAAPRAKAKAKAATRAKPEDKDVAEVRKFVELLDECGLAEIEFKRAGLKVRVRKDGAAPVAVAAPVQAAPVAPTKHGR